MTVMRQNLYGRSLAEIQEILGPLTDRPFHARQLYGWIHSRGERDFSRMSNLPLPLRSALAGRYRIALPGMEARQKSRDGTIKYLLRLEDGKAVEAVAIPEAGRITLCISSQIGCPLACTFCLTGRMGLVRNLTPGEILGQAAVLSADHHLLANEYNLVLMGMGEPLHNYDSVLAAFRILSDPEGFGIAPRHVTLSTAGVIPGLLRLAKEKPRPRIAVCALNPDGSMETIGNKPPAGLCGSGLVDAVALLLERGCIVIRLCLNSIRMIRPIGEFRRCLAAQERVRLMGVP